MQPLAEKVLMATQADLRQQLLELDQRGYKAYRAIQTDFAFPEFILIVDRVQADPFATPSQCRVQMPQAIAGFPQNFTVPGAVRLPYGTTLPASLIRLRDLVSGNGERVTVV